LAGFSLAVFLTLGIALSLLTVLAVGKAD
jgi:hypothetical protein